ncbi:tRNA-intron lyase [Candidatus Bathyarchaeota archaeon]|nr:tRNA-intron lyase [Candidatus Bathyarchaeota archaeon]
MPSFAQLIENNRLIVWDVDQGNELFSGGFFGKPLGIPKPKEVFDTPLVLDSIEGLYLAETGRLRVQDMKGQFISPRSLRKRITEGVQGFDAKYKTYTDLRKKGYVVTPGIKYGCDFAVYEHGPGIDHAPYIVQVWSGGQSMEAAEMVKAGRLATTVRKSFILAIVDDQVRYLEFDWWKA